MGMFRDVGNFAGEASGWILGKPIEFVGHMTESEMISSIGKGVNQTSRFAGDIIGQVADGVVNNAVGYVTKDTQKCDEGLVDLSDAYNRTAKGVKSTAKMTAANGKDIYTGYVDKDNERMKSGIKGIVTTAAIGVIAISVLDFLGGPDQG